MCFLVSWETCYESNWGERSSGVLFERMDYPQDTGYPALGVVIKLMWLQTRKQRCFTPAKIIRFSCHFGSFSLVVKSKITWYCGLKLNLDYKNNVLAT